jgi:hypothetical protein
MITRWRHAIPKRTCLERLEKRGISPDEVDQERPGGARGRSRTRRTEVKADHAWDAHPATSALTVNARPANGLSSNTWPAMDVSVVPVREATGPTRGRGLRHLHQKRRRHGHQHRPRQVSRDRRGTCRSRASPSAWQQPHITAATSKRPGAERADGSYIDASWIPQVHGDPTIGSTRSSTSAARTPHLLTMVAAEGS